MKKIERDSDEKIIRGLMVFLNIFLFVINILTAIPMINIAGIGIMRINRACSAALLL